MMLPSPLPIQPIFEQDGYQDQGNREVDYQPINFMSGNRQQRVLGICQACPDS